MQQVKSIMRVMRSKYVIALAFFIIWMLFFDPRDWGLIYQRQQKLDNLKQSEKTMAIKIADTRKELALLKTSAQTIEKYAREKYYMKKDNEDVFIVKIP